MVKFLRNLLAALFIACALSIFSFYMFIETQGKSIVEKELTAVFDRKVTSTDVKFIFPLGLRIDGIDVPDMLKVEATKVQFGFPVRLEDQWIVSQITLVKPSIFTHKHVDSSLKFGRTAAQPTDETSKAPSQNSASKKDSQSKNYQSMKMIIDYLEVVEGEVTITAAHGEKKDFALKEVSLKARSVPFPPNSSKTRLNVTALIFDPSIPFSGHRIEGNGWINVYDKDMDGQLKIVEPDGLVALRVDLKSKSNDLNVKGQVNIKSLMAPSAPKKGKESYLLDDLIFAALDSKGVDITADFAFKTKMDNFQLNTISLSGVVAEESANSLTEGLKDFGKSLVEKKSKSQLKE